MYFLKHIKVPRRPIDNVAQLTNANGENRATTFGKSDPTRSKQRCCKNQFFDKEYYNGISPAAKKEEKIENTTEVLRMPEDGKVLVFFFSLAELKTTHISLYLNVILKWYKITLRELVLPEVNDTDRSSLWSPCISIMYLSKDGKRHHPPAIVTPYVWICVRVLALWVCKEIVNSKCLTLDNKEEMLADGQVLIRILFFQ